jgi:hypothetical protein
MPIPTAHDRRLAEIDTVAQGIVTQLMTMHRANGKDRLRMRLVLRERLQDFIDMAMQAADQAGD